MLGLLGGGSRRCPEDTVTRTGARCCYEGSLGFKEACRRVDEEDANQVSTEVRHEDEPSCRVDDNAVGVGCILSVCDGTGSGQGVGEGLGAVEDTADGVKGVAGDSGSLTVMRG